MYNKKMLAAAGVTAPKTWDEMKAAAATIKTKTVSYTHLDVYKRQRPRRARTAST